MVSRIKTTTTVLLVGADAGDVASLQPAAETLAAFGVGMETVVTAGGGLVSAVFDGKCAVIAASTDGELPDMIVSMTNLPVIRVPVATAEPAGLGSLMDGTGRLPSGAAGGGVFATMAIGAAGARNAALFLVATLALEDERLRAEYAAFRARQTADVLKHPPLEL